MNTPQKITLTGLRVSVERDIGDQNVGEPVEVVQIVAREEVEIPAADLSDSPAFENQSTGKVTIPHPPQ